MTKRKGRSPPLQYTHTHTRAHAAARPELFPPHVYGTAVSTSRGRRPPRHTVDSAMSRGGSGARPAGLCFSSTS